MGEGTVAGSGTYTRDGFIYASLAGFVIRNVNNDRTVRNSVSKLWDFVLFSVIYAQCLS